MTGLSDGTLAEWLEAEGFAPLADGPGALADVPRIRALLVAAAQEGRSVSYSELLGALGFRFTRPKMRALCKTLEMVDREAAAADEPELAVLVVRETDRLPGQGWWVGLAEVHRHKGAWEGPEAGALVRELQGRAFDYWRGR